MQSLALITCVALAVAGFSALLRGSREELRLSAVTLCLGAIGWIAVTHLWDYSNLNQYVPLALLFISVSMVAASGYVNVRKMVEVDSEIAPWHMLVIIFMPLVVAAFTLLGWGVPDPAEWRTSPTYIVQAIYVYGHLILMIIVLTKRQRDPSMKIRIAVGATQALVAVGFFLENSFYQYTPFVAAILALLATWASHWPETWWQAPTDADELLDAIGVFILVLDDQGRLRKWNASAGKLIEAVAHRTPMQRGLYVEKILGTPIPKRDGSVLEFSIGSGVLRTECNTQEIRTGKGPNDYETVVMLRPLKSRIDSAKFTAPSGELPGYDPVTQTLSRKSMLETIHDADFTVRLEFRPTSTHVRPDEAMFVVARRLEASFGSYLWGRIDTWGFATVVESRESAEHLAEMLTHSPVQAIDDELNVYSKVYIDVREANEGGADFARRVAEPRLRESEISNQLEIELEG
ncbi:MAG: hypothetical protein E6Q27_09280 [Aeromicrobium sp.]|nr:MAG: hypothetical protein E6Q27_09280 [Aeromicrobium sp.]